MAAKKALALVITYLHPMYVDVWRAQLPWVGVKEDLAVIRCFRVVAAVTERTLKDEHIIVERYESG